MAVNMTVCGRKWQKFNKNSISFKQPRSKVSFLLDRKSNRNKTVRKCQLRMNIIFGLKQVDKGQIFTVKR